MYIIRFFGSCHLMEDKVPGLVPMTVVRSVSVF